MKILHFIFLLILISCSGNPSFNWITINYDQLVNKKIITHNGKTVGEVIAEIPRYTKEYKGNVQPYLEPFSILCHDALLASNKPDTLPLVNIITHYPIGSEQPVWAALFREGHYQLYYNNELIRVFIKGSKSNEAFEKHQSIIRHPINDIISSKNTAIKKVEVYVFENSYSKTEIRLNTIPTTYDIKKLDLSSSKKSMDLNSIDEFLKSGVALEAIEVDTGSNLFLYGQRDPKQSLASYPVSLADFAVVYRSIFHFGNNAPYISLDTHEDNRYAKVNFGGHYENTHIGSVVLEADKLFKTLSTGLDPNTHKLVIDNFKKVVPGFFTENERELLSFTGKGTQQIRYWFYPDSIGTVTDGTIGAILNYQFHADVERMDVKIAAGNSVKNTIKHLNDNYRQYEDAHHTFKELSTVGRIMALMNWLKGMNISAEIDLDQFLTVMIPSFTTPKKTKKLLALNSASYFKSQPLNRDNIRQYSQVRYLSNLMDNYNPNTSDETFINIADQYFQDLPDEETYPPFYLDIVNRLERIESSIEYKERNLNRYSSRDVDDFNQQVKEQNDLVNRINSLGGIQTPILVSIGGGINLRPKSFRQISRNMHSSKIKKINNLKTKIRTTGKISKMGNWLRSNVSIKRTGSRINPVAIDQWTSSRSSDDALRYSHKSNYGNKAIVTKSNISGDWTSTISIGGIEEAIYFKNSSERKSFTVVHELIGAKYKGLISGDGKYFTFTL